MVGQLLHFLEDLTNWWIKLNRPKLKGDQGRGQDWHTALSIL